MERLLEADEGLTYSVSHTTRDPRPNEVHGEDYYFVDEEEFERVRAQSGFIEWAEIYGDYYGTSREEVDRIRREGLDPFLDIDVQGAEQLRDDSGLDAVFVFLAPPSLEDLEKRISRRGSESEERMRERLRVAGDEITRIPEFDYLVVNDDLEVTVSQLYSVVSAERLKV
ncbi:guanylate kinase [Candidatus Bipolaricaulota bacterium]|nr:guanylate kinase [Candidatus Bipolaricaulota bacterium]